jgi:hypothetical protein
VLYTFDISDESSFVISIGIFGQGCFTTATASCSALCACTEVEH